MAMTPDQVAQKWQRNLAASSESMKQGAQSVQVSPTQAAAARQQAYVAGVQAAVDSGKWQRGLNRVSLGDWQQAYLNKGIPRVSTGATAAVPKMSAFMQQWLPYEQNLKAQLASMPRGDLVQNIARMVRAVEYNAAFKRQ